MRRITAYWEAKLGRYRSYFSSLFSTEYHQRVPASSMAHTINDLAPNTRRLAESYISNSCRRFLEGRFKQIWHKN